MVIGQWKTFLSSLEAIAPAHWQLIQAPALMQAKQIVQSEVVDLIILTIDPGQLGFSAVTEFVTELRLRAGVAHLPIIIIDNEADVDRQAESFAMGADAYFTPPIDSRYFPAAIDTRLMLSQVLAESAPPDQGVPPLSSTPVTAPEPPEQVSSIESREYFEENFLRLKSLLLRTRDLLSRADEPDRSFIFFRYVVRGDSLQLYLVKDKFVKSAINDPQEIAMSRDLARFIRRNLDNDAMYEDPRIFYRAGAGNR